MSKKILLALVERLREAGQRKWHVGLEWDTWENCPKHPEGCANPDKPKDVCTCGADKHNAAVDAAAKALVAEIKRTEEDFGRCPGCGQPYLTKAKICGNPRCNRDCLHGG